MNSLIRVIVALLGAMALLVGVGACGASSPGPQALLSETFDSKTPIESGRLDLSLTLSGSASSALKSPVSVSLSGPFQSVDPHKLPRFDLQAGLTVAGHTLHLGAVSTSSHFFIELEGTSFMAPESTVRALQEGYAHAGTPATHTSATFSALGIDPGRWLVNPVNAGTARIDGVETLHLVASLDVARFLADASRLSSAGSALEVSARQGSATGLISPETILALAHAVKSARVDVYTGKEDRLLRRLVLTATLSSKNGGNSTLEGLRTATLHLDLQFSDLNRPQTIIAPSNPRPISELVGVLQQLGVVPRSSSAGAAITGAQATSISGEAGAPARKRPLRPRRPTWNALRGPARACRRCRGAPRCCTADRSAVRVQLGQGPFDLLLDVQRRLATPGSPLVAGHDQLAHLVDEHRIALALPRLARGGSKEPCELGIDIQGGLSLALQALVACLQHLPDLGLLLGPVDG